MIRRTRAQALIIQGGKVLLAKHHDLTIDQVYWCMPGGGVEAGETPEQAAVRELKEETNLDIRIIAKIGELMLPGVTHGYTTGHTFLAEVIGGDMQKGHDPEQVHWEDKYLQDVQWRVVDAELLLSIQSILRLQTEDNTYPSPYVLLAPACKIGI
jgi:8-oxo-dGTP pyrophosphatase MutT (NUDIX family)